MMMGNAAGSGSWKYGMVGEHPHCKFKNFRVSGLCHHPVLKKS
jgi:hypothetical protein